MTHPRRAGLAVLGIAVAGAIAAVLATTHANATTASAAQLNVRNTSLGRILVDRRGRTLYLFRADKGTKSVCYGQCASFWPPLIATKAPQTAPGLKAKLFGTTTRKNGAKQVTYRGHPLYRFAQDTKAGQVNGEGLDHFGGLWWAVSSTGAAVVHQAAAPAPTTTTPMTTSPGGYGYP